MKSLKIEMKFVLTLLTLVIGTVSAFVCPPDICDDPSYKNVNPLQCRGSVIKGGGFCGCTDACAKVAGESCQARPSMVGRTSIGTCDAGLHCVPHGEMTMLGWGRCETDHTKLKNDIYSPSHAMTECERQRRVRLISMVVWQGMWTPVCDAKGLFVPQQCDNTGMCFCVDAHTGHVNLDTKVRGPATC